MNGGAGLEKNGGQGRVNLSVFDLHICSWGGWTIRRMNFRGLDGKVVANGEVNGLWIPEAHLCADSRKVGTLFLQVVHPQVRCMTWGTVPIHFLSQPPCVWPT